MIRILLLVSCCATLVCAETQQERGKRIVNEALSAMGGQKFLTMQDRVESGRAYSFYREQLKGLAIAKLYTRYGMPAAGTPDAPTVSEREGYGKDEDQVILFAEGNGFILTYRGAKPLPQDRIERYRESTLRNVLYIFRMRLKEPGIGFASAGSDIVDNMPVELVDIYDAQNRTVRVAFHKSTKLPIKETFEYRDPKTKEKFEEVFYFSKWRDIGGGVQWPFHMERQRNGEKVFELFSDSVTYGKNLKADLFMLPNSMKVLAQEK